MDRRVAGLVFVLIAATVAGGQEWLPPELRGLLPDTEAFACAIESKLESMLGRPFPDWELANGRKNVSLLSISPGPLVILYAGGPCPTVVAELNRLAETGWGSSGGVLVTVFKDKGAFRESVVRRATKGRPHVYYVASWDASGVPNYIRGYPTYLFLDSDHRLIAFQVRDRKRFEANRLEDAR